ncbi:antibiotic biosynthesis monooxygenase family protein [uncultured Desulfobulbus sp.]|jgi:quinol monooxygenase YgiN|uniref:putative quinol monooxygenase n=1 Tax=uncultured Desulfobulbus sp. TaxID=239745 RepID=UPI0029C8DAA6|nr:antibiotic biosynthesis monooxygenase family protein [uncultured Desulfobulbus sp.]
MIIVRTIMTVLPEKQKEVLQTLHSLIEPPEKEKGCLSYDIFGDIEDVNVFNLISEWETRQHLDQHMRSDRFSVLLGTKCLLSEPLQIKIATVVEYEGMDAVCSIRKKSADCSRAPYGKERPA